jgi:hypothetical protein
LAAAAAKIEQLGSAVKEQQAKSNSLLSTRTLTVSQQNAIFQALNGVFSLSEPLSVVWQPDSQDATEYAGCFIGPLKALKCLGYRSVLVSTPPVIRGLILVTEDWRKPTQTATALRSALDSAKVSYTLESGKPFTPGTVTIVVGVKGVQD